jgi:hypothetical protein
MELAVELAPAPPQSSLSPGLGELRASHLGVVVVAGADRRAVGRAPRGATSMMNSISSAPRRPHDWSCCRPHLLHLRVCAATRRTPPAAPAPARHVQPCCLPNRVGASSAPSLSLGCGAVTVPDLHGDIESLSASRPHPVAGAGRDVDRALGNAPAAVEDTRRPGSETRRMRPPLRHRGSAGGG